MKTKDAAIHMKSHCVKNRQALQKITGNITIIVISRSCMRYIWIDIMKRYCSYMSNIIFTVHVRAYSRPFPDLLCFVPASTSPATENRIPLFRLTIG